MPIVFIDSREGSQVIFQMFLVTDVHGGAPRMLPGALATGKTLPDQVQAKAKEEWADAMSAAAAAAEHARRAQEASDAAGRYARAGSSAQVSVLILWLYVKSGLHSLLEISCSFCVPQSKASQSNVKRITVVCNSMYEGLSSGESIENGLHVVYR